MSWSGVSAVMADMIPVITGATATGKTALSLALARRINAHIISVDSRQVYRGMDIGTAKPDATELAAVRHYGIDVVNPDERYSAGRFARDARQWIAQIRSSGRTPLLVGGTGFFLRSLSHPLFAQPHIAEGRRRALEGFLSGLSDADLRRWASALDPFIAAPPRDRQRMLRSIEVSLLAGRPLSWWQRHAPAPEPSLPLRVFVLELPRAELYRRINERVIRMVQSGLVEEVQRLIGLGYDRDDPGMNATGYPELLDYLEGRIGLDEAIDRIQSATRRYARRQLTWFRHQLPAGARRLDALRDTAQLLDEIVSALHAEEAAA
jgi:tRNA dimethylallyltransferase